MAQADAHKTNRVKIALRLGIPAVYVAYLLLAYSRFGVSLDDPFITFRYARNIVNGNGAVFNLGERVEGFSSPLHLLVAVLLIHIAPSVGLLFKAKLVSVLFGALTLFQTGRIARAAGQSPLVGLAAQWLVALNIGFVFSSVNGLETTMASFLGALCLTLYLKELREPGFPLSAVVGLVAVLARPEALLPCSALALLVFAGPTAKRFSSRERVQYASVYFGGLAVMLSARFAYYGDWLPNTYYAKHPALPDAVSKGVKYLASGIFGELMPIDWSPPWMHALWSLTFFGLLLAGAYVVRKSADVIPFIAVILADTLFVLRAGGDWMPGWRFLMLVIGPIAVLQAIGLKAFARTIELPNTKICATAAIICVLAFPVITALRLSWKAVGYATDDRTLLLKGSVVGPLWVGNAELLRDKLPANCAILYSEMGYTGWINERMHFIDLAGLCDRAIAHAPNVVHDDTGVNARNDWFLPQSPVIAEIKRLSPYALVVPTMPPATCFEKGLLFGKYRSAGKMPGFYAPAQAFILANGQ